MSINKTYAVFGLGRYGKAVAAELVANGAEVLAVDSDKSAVDDAAALLPVCKCADVTDPDTFKRLGISNIDTVVIAMAGSMEASVMTTMLCKEAGVSNVIAKCKDEIHGRILSRVGADRVLFPETDSGRRLAKNLLSSGFIDMAEISDKVSVVDIEVRPDWVGKSLAELRLREKFSVNVIAVVRDGRADTAVNPSAPIKAGMHLIVVADKEKLRRLK